MVTGSTASPLPALADAEFDLLVVGGGITGACIALEGAIRGLRTALVDRGDFGGGATANCLRIVHGGLRYLQHLDVRRSRESSQERSMWLRSAPHLVEPLPVVVPTRRGTFPPRALLAGALAFNDLLSADRNAGLPAERRLPRARVLSPREVTALVPELDVQGLTGGVLFHDAVMYSPERLTLEVVAAARAAGVACGNHVSLQEALVREGRIEGARLRDELTGDAVTLRTRWLVNASGAAAPTIAEQLLGQRARSSPAYSVALNLLTRQPATGPAFTITGGTGDPDRVVGSGGRQLFVVPWRGERLIGTAHLPYIGDASAPTLQERDVDRFLDELRTASPSITLTRDDVRVVQWGLLPVAGVATDDRIRLLKHHQVLDHRGDGVAGAMSVVSVKFTTARRVAVDVMDRIAPRTAGGTRGSPDVRLSLPGWQAMAPTAALAEARARFGDGLPNDVLEHLLRVYGARAGQVVALRAHVADWDRRVVPGAPVIRAQLVFGALAEQGRTVEDLLWRRTEIGGRGLATDEARVAAAAALREAAKS